VADPLVEERRSRGAARLMFVVQAFLGLRQRNACMVNFSSGG
jgi:hypothetical protein